MNWSGARLEMKPPVAAAAAAAAATTACCTGLAGLAGLIGAGAVGMALGATEDKVGVNSDPSSSSCARSLRSGETVAAGGRAADAEAGPAGDALPRLDEGDWVIGPVIVNADVWRA